MHSLIAFATQWGSKFGGINSFNTDFLSAFGIAYLTNVQIVCVISSAEVKEIEDAKNCNVTLVKLPYAPEDKIFTAEHAEVAIAKLNSQSIYFDPKHTVWLGHDRISGEAAIHAAKLTSSRSALIHHMSYDSYETFAENSKTASNKTSKQKELFKQADIALAVGPLLRDSLIDLLAGTNKTAQMIIPGLAEITPKPTPKFFSAFISGRLSDDAARIKQCHLGVAAYAKAISNARHNNAPESLLRNPKIVLRGVDFESRQSYDNNQPQTNPELELQQFAEEYANARINLHARPYTQNREDLYEDLRSASVAIMPSWHEGFGLVAWEAIAAGVPLIISKDSGVYEFLKEFHPGTETGFVKAITVNGSNEKPFFNEFDLNDAVAAITSLATYPDRARSQSATLRNLLSNYTWTACAEKVIEYLSWDLQKGSPKKNIPVSTSPVVDENKDISMIDWDNEVSPSPLYIPTKYWKLGHGIAESQLLRADEALVPFDSARQPVIEQLNTWLDDDEWPLAIRLITGAGGVGKTRLAIEICQQRLKAGWHCGFLGKRHSARDMAHVWQRLLGINQPLLLVIDYAETRQTVLLALIKVIINKTCATKASPNISGCTVCKP